MKADQSMRGNNSNGRPEEGSLIKTVTKVDIVDSDLIYIMPSYKL